MKQVLSTLVIILFSMFNLNAQYAKHELSLAGGLSPYLGDINKNFLYSPSQSGFGARLGFKYNLNPSVGMRIGLGYMTLNGDDKNFETPSWRKLRGFNFTNNLIEGSIVAEYDFLAKRRIEKGQTDKKISIYGLGGVAFVFHKPTVAFNEPNTIAKEADIKSDKAELGSLASFILPLGVGLRYNINKEWAIAGEFNSNIAFSDYLDGISQTGNPDKNDWYAFFSLNIIKKINWQEKKEEK